MNGIPGLHKRAMPLLKLLSQSSSALCVPFLPFPFPLAQTPWRTCRQATQPAVCSRLHTFHATCVACLKDFHTIPRAQRHNKGSRDCLLLRACRLLQPLSLMELRDVELQDKQKAKRIKAGRWDLCNGPPPPVQTPSALQIRAA